MAVFVVAVQNCVVCVTGISAAASLVCLDLDPDGSIHTVGVCAEFGNWTWINMDAVDVSVHGLMVMWTRGRG